MSPLKKSRRLPDDAQTDVHPLPGLIRHRLTYAGPCDGFLGRETATSPIAAARFFFCNESFVILFMRAYMRLVLCVFSEFFQASAVGPIHDMWRIYG